MLKVDIDSFSYSEVTILKDIHFRIKSGEHLSILGESGCGKSTLLHLIYGLLNLDEGEIHYNNTKLLGPGHSLVPGEPFMKLVAQEFDIMPFTTVAENLASFLTGLDEDKNRIEELLEVVELQPFKNTLVKNLSGGQKQRVALAKALANEPQILLLDEPFSNIDVFKKSKLRRNLFNHLKEKNVSCISATHDSEEALAFSDYILMLKNGSMEMFGRPEEIYQNVSDEYQGGFFGDVNVLPKQLFSSARTEGEVLIFPHQLQISTMETDFPVVVEKCYFHGTHYLIQSKWNNKDIFFNHFKKLKKGSVFHLEYH
ncbi:ABC transporter ATP-binding protein [Aequorivita sp. H23M31]|uniref:ABC transporter ATP-binding protein n=1 Tax=Aequorivita ciconiae TaxID=2494375 RepID=A0A410G524_9FLAO|nr:ABC transporter ATP-binding protein [Aequorivita sp. H23M31]QAA82331.1 ABC transporter ATP-binding protein [Aequorivita sp. H23M31]